MCFIRLFWGRNAFIFDVILWSLLENVCGLLDFRF